MIDRIRTRLRPVVGLLVVGFFFAALMTLAVHFIRLDEQFDQSTHRSRATIEYAWRTSGKGAHDDVRLHFRDDHDRMWTDTINDVSRGTFASMKVGTIVPIKYLAEDPGQCRIDLPNESQYHWDKDKILLYLALGVGAVWVLVFVSSVANRR